MASGSADLSDHFVWTRVTRGGGPRLDLHVRTQEDRLSYIGSMPDPEQMRQVTERMFGTKTDAGEPMVIVSPDGRAVAFYHRSDLSNERPSQESGVYVYEYDRGSRLLHSGNDIVGIPFSRRNDVPRDVLTFRLLNVSGGWNLVPWAVTLTTEGHDEFPLALLGATDLHRAAYQGNVPVITQLLDDGHDVNAQSYWGHTPLYVAIVSYEEQAAIRLAERGADLTTGDNFYLHLAAMHGQSDLIDEFVNRGIDVNTVDTLGKSPLHVATEAYRSGVTEEVYGQRGRITAEAAEQRVATLLRHGADPNAKSDSGNTALHNLARNDGQHDMPSWAFRAARMLIDAGADAAARNAQGSTPLHLFSLGSGFGGLAPTRNERLLAAEVGRWEKSDAHAMLALLVSLSPDIDARNADGMTALQLTLRWNHVLTAQYLIAHGADDRVVDRNGVSVSERIDRALASQWWTPANLP